MRVLADPFSSDLRLLRSSSTSLFVFFRLRANECSVGVVVAPDGFVGERRWPRRDNASACRAGSFSSPTTAAVSASGTARPASAGAPARPPAKPLGWPNPPTRTTSVGPCMWLGCRPGASRIPDTAAAGFDPRPRYKMPWLRKCLLPLRNLPIVLRPRWPPRRWRYKITG